MTKHSESVVLAQQLKQFGLIMALMIMAIFALLLPWWYAWPFSVLPWLISATFALFALLWPVGLRPVYKLWMQIGQIAGFINTRILLFLIFFLILWPVGLIARLLGHDPLGYHKSTWEKASFYMPCEQHEGDDNHMEKPF